MNNIDIHYDRTCRGMIYGGFVSVIIWLVLIAVITLLNKLIGGSDA